LSDWPGDENIQILVNMAIPLFIFAATVCRFVADPNWDPKKRLNTILEYQKAGLVSKLKGTYDPILEQLLRDQDEEEEEIIAKEFREVVGTIVVLVDPLSVVSLASLLTISEEDINDRIRSLHSVLNVPTNNDAPVKPFHLSFREYLLDPRNCGRSTLRVDERETHRMIATKCIELLSGPQGLAEDMCDLKSPGKLRAEMNKQTIDKRLPAHVQYACRYWVYHVEHSKDTIIDQDQTYRFLEEHFFHWLEALSIMGNMSEAIALVSTLQKLAAVS
jgi:hypothetical protein